MAYVELLGYLGLTAAVGFVIVLMVCACVALISVVIDVVKGRL